MLQKIRSALKGVVIVVVVIFAFAAFALTGMPGIDQLGSGAAITAGGTHFTARQVRNEYNRIIRLREQETGGTYDREEALAENLPGQVTGMMVTRAILDRFAARLGLHVSDSRVGEYLRRNEDFHNPATGSFDRIILEGILERNGLTITQFRDRIAQDLKRREITDAISRTGPAPSVMTEAALLRESGRRRIAYITVTGDMADTGMHQPSAEELEAYYETRITDFMTPEYRTFDLVRIMPADLMESLSVPEGQLEKIYEHDRARLYEKPGRRSLVRISFNTQDAALEAAAALRRGESPETAAASGGAISAPVVVEDARPRDILDPAVAAQAFAQGLAEGSVPDPVKSAFGWTVIRIGTVTPPSVRPFAEVRDDIRLAYLEKDARRAMFAAVETLEAERDTGATLAEAAAAAGLESRRTGPVDRFGFAPGGAIADSIPGEALAEAFLLETGDESRAIGVSGIADDGRENIRGYVFIAVHDIMEPVPLPFEDVEEKIRKEWADREHDRLMDETVLRFTDAVEAGQSFDAVAQSSGRAPIVKVIGRNFEDEIISASLNRKIFLASAGDIVSGPTALGAARAVIEVRNISFAMNAVTEERKKDYARYLGTRLDLELSDALLKGLEDDYGVKVDYAQLQTLYEDGS